MACCTRSSDGHFYYYHTLHTIKLVLENGTIRARNCAYLNDSDEYRFGLMLLRSLLDDPQCASSDFLSVRAELAVALRDLDHNEPHLYPVCLTTNPPLDETSLPHWVMYAHEGGVALELSCSTQPDPAFLAKPADGDKEDRVPLTQVRRDTTDANLGPVEVAYLPLDELTGLPATNPAPEHADLLRVTPLTDPGGYAIHVKRAAFALENEYRLAFNPRIGGKSAVEYIDLDGLISPFVDVYWGASSGWPVISVTVGPGKRQERVYSSLRTFLGGSTIKIRELGLQERKDLVQRCLERWEGIAKSRRRESLRVRLAEMSTRLVSGRSPTEAPMDFGQAVDTEVRALLTQVFESHSRWANEDKQVLGECLSACCIVFPHGLLLQRANVPYVY